MATLYAGTSGFAYPAWKPGFYPAKLPAARFLEHYASRLNCVEINYTFRRMPAATTLSTWVDLTPEGFLFVVKAHQQITHFRRLKDAGEPTQAFLASLQPLREAGKLGPVLFQLPPQLKLDLERLEAFLALLPPGLRYAFEFRDASWFVEDVYSMLRQRGAALCVAESEKLQVPDAVTAGFTYYRLRKPTYDDADLDGVVARSRELLADDRDVFVLFKHEEDPTGALYAERILAAA
ncbi:MAG TPA: DUF72 domain-containing protein [Thermoleophilia bacterium]|nr:DUF72 domain-containing protein [Thermoleophilia bacterium]